HQHFISWRKEAGDGGLHRSSAASGQKEHRLLCLIQPAKTFLALAERLFDLRSAVVRDLLGHRQPHPLWGRSGSRGQKITFERSWHRGFRGQGDPVACLRTALLSERRLGLFAAVGPLYSQDDSAATGRRVGVHLCQMDSTWRVDRSWASTQQKDDAFWLIC